MKVALGCDHGGFEYKEAIKQQLIKDGYEVFDAGTFGLESCHYPQFAFHAGEYVAKNEGAKGILICTTGEGIMISANKVKGIRCGIGYNDEVTKMMREHNNANMIAFGQKHMSLDDVLRRVEIFLKTPFAGDRHQTRVDMINNY